MAKTSKKTKKAKSELEEAIQETLEGLKDTGVVQSSPAVEAQEVSTKDVRKKKALNVSEVSVAPAKVPPSQRLFPVSLLTELDDIKSRLDKLEQAIAKISKS